MSLPQSFRELLQGLESSFRAETISVFLTDKDARPAVQESLRTLATLRKMRPQTISQLGKDDRVRLFLTSLSHPQMETAAMQALQVWFLRKGRSLMAQLLDAWSVPHTDGELPDDAVLPTLTAEQVRAACTPALSVHPKAALLAYLGYNVLGAPEESWAGACGSIYQELQAA